MYRIADKCKLLKERYPKHTGQQYQICPVKKQRIAVILELIFCYVY